MSQVRNKDYVGHTGTINPKYPTAGATDDSEHTGDLNHGVNGAKGSYSNHLEKEMDSEHALRQIRTAGSISISPELFERLYLSPQNQVKGELRRTFGNPTPLCLIGFLLSLTPLSCDLMGWRAAGGNGIASIGAYYFFGGLLMILGSIFEFILGNTLPFIVFGSFGAFWLAFAETLNTIQAPAQTADFPQSFAFFLLFMSVLCTIFLIASLRTNILFVIIFLTLIPTFALLAGVYWHLAVDATAMAGRLQIAAGACAFIACLCGWWLLLAQTLASVDFPLQVPVFDISHIIKPASQKKAREEQYSA